MYPLLENALRPRRGRSIEDHNKAMGKLFARFAAAARDNPLATRRNGFSAGTITSVNDRNRMIGFPYPKLMNSNAFVDQAAAVLMTSAAKRGN